MTKWRRWRLGWTRKRKWRRGTRRVAVCGGVGGWVGGGGEGGEMMVDNDVGHISQEDEEAQRWLQRKSGQ